MEGPPDNRETIEKVKLKLAAIIVLLMALRMMGALELACKCIIVLRFHVKGVRL